MAAKRVFYRFLACFLALSLLDLLITTYLLYWSNGPFYEGNPLAKWFLDEFGWSGLTLFKLSTIGFVMCLMIVIYKYRPPVGRQVLAFGCTVLAIVVTYSGALAIVRNDSDALAEARVLGWHNAHLDRLLYGTAEYMRVKRHLADEFVAGRRTITAVVSELMESMSASQQLRVDLRKRYPGFTDEQCVALNFVESTLGSAEGRFAAVLRDRLESELRSSYNTSLPSGVRPVR